MKKILFILLTLALAWTSQILTAQTLVFDDSDGPFSLLTQMATVLSPNGGESWNGAETHNVTWSAVSSITSVNIDYSTNSGSSWTPVAANIANSGSYAWTVPATPSLNCLIRVSDAANAATLDASDTVFTIAVGSETISVPSMPTGPTTGTVNTSYDFSTGGSTSSMGHALQYKFDWGDGTDSGWLATGTTGADHVWTVNGTYQVRAMARCATHTSIESSWSVSHTISINNVGFPFLLWNTFQGGSGYEDGNSIAVDNNGNTYITGCSSSSWGSPKRAYSSGNDAFVAKFNAGGEMQWNTFLGGSDTDWGNGIAVDGSGNVYVTGYSRSTWGDPLLPYKGNSDAFVAKISAGGDLQWNTFLGGSNNDPGYGIAVDSSGNIYVSGESGTTWGGPLRPYSGGDDAFVAKLNTIGVLQWNTFLGGNSSDAGKGIAVGSTGDIYLTGESSSTWGSPLNPYGGSNDVFVVKVNANGALQWHTFLGGNSHDTEKGIAVDSNGNVFIAGEAYATWGNPVNPYASGNSDAFVAKLNGAGNYQWHTFLGGNASDSGKGIAADHSGNIYVTGDSSSTWGTPLNPFPGVSSAFVAKLNAIGVRQWNTFLGGYPYNGGNGIARDISGNIYMTGNSSSGWGSPLHPFSGQYDAFVAKLGVYLSALTVTSPNGGENWISNTAHNITWSSTSTIANVNIDYSIDSGSSWTLVAANIANSGTYAWTVPATISTNCLVRVSDASNASVFDVSDAVFTIYITQTLTMIAPNGGENWISGTVQNVTWSSTGTIANVNIDYSTNNGVNWTPVVANTANSGSYAWTVPATLSTNCLVRISDAANAGTYDVSNSVFSISAPPVEIITAPNQPTGPGIGLRNTNFSFSTGGSTSSFGHDIQYRFDWGDGTDSGWLATGTTGADHVWTVNGTYQVRAMARCATHTGVESPWSAAHTVIIYDVDTPVLKWHTFLGGNDSDSAYSIAVDNSGNIYVVGDSSSTWGSPLHTYSGNGDILVAKFNAGGVLQWHTFLGGSSADSGYCIAVDNNGNIFVTGESDSTWGSPLNPYGNGDYDAFIAKLNTNGVLQWHTFLGGSITYGSAITVDGSGNIYIAGSSDSTWGNPLNAYFGGQNDAFVAKLNASGLRQWHTFLGGNDSDQASSIAVDNSGNIFITGGSFSSWGSPLNPYSGDYDAFVAKLNANGSREWHTFLGGISVDWGTKITLDSSRNIFVTGESNSTWGNPLNPYSGNSDALVVKLNSSGIYQWHTFLGGNNNDYGDDITIDSSGNIYVVGGSGSTWGNPLNPYSGNSDALVVKLNSSGIYQWHTFLGGIADDDGFSITLDGSGNVYVTGRGGSTWGSPLHPYGGGYSDAFVAKLGLYSSTLTVTSPNGGENWIGGTAQNITWTSPDTIANVKIDYSTNNGSSWSPVAANIANSGTYAWTVPTIPSTTCLVRICDAANNATNDVSNGMFTISIVSTLMISGTVTLGGSGLANVVMNGLPGNPTTNASGFYTATVNQNWSGTATPALAGYIFSPANRTYTNVVASQLTQDYSAVLNAYTISGTVTLGGSGLANVVMNGLPGNPPTNASGLYTTTINYGWSGTATPILAGYTFNPANKTYSSVTANQTTNYTATINSSLVVTTPNGSENWIRGSVYTIRWTSSNVANVKIELLKANVLNSTISSSTSAANGSYNWTISAAQAIAGDYKVRITSTTSSTITDSSDANFAIAAPFVTVTTPNGGEQWQRGTSQIITWTSSGVTNVKIDLLKGTSVNLAITSSTPGSSGSYSWTVPDAQTAGTDYKIRITSTAASTVTDSSNASFSIFAPTITVTTPAAANAWIRGTTRNITWTTQGTVNANVKIQLFKGTTKTLDITTSTPTVAGTFAWSIPSTLAAATTYAVKVIALDNLVTGTSGTFSIVSAIITVTSPVTGTKWQRGIVHTITWTGEGTLNANVKIQLYKGTAVDSTIISTTPNNGSYNWTIPANKTLATTYKIRVTTADSLVYGESGTFSITSTANVQLQAPNGNECLAVYAVFPIRWSADRSVSEVKLEYSRDKGGTFFTIADNVPNSGQYEWNVPVNFTFNGIIRVSDSYGKNWLDEGGVLECLFKFNCSSLKEERQSDLAMWFGGAKVKAPGYEFARVAIGRDMVMMSEVSRVMEPLSSGWHEAKIRLDLKRDLGALFIDNQRVLENVALYTSPDHHFESYLSIRVGGGATVDLLLAELTVQATLLDADGNEKDRFTILNEDFSDYDAEHNLIGSCWQVSGLKPDGPALSFKTLPGMGQALWLQSAADAPVTISKPLAIPEKIPFDISDRSFIIEMWQGDD